MNRKSIEEVFAETDIAALRKAFREAQTHHRHARLSGKAPDPSQKSRRLTNIQPNFALIVKGPFTRLLPSFLGVNTKIKRLDRLNGTAHPDSSPYPDFILFSLLA